MNRKIYIPVLLTIVLSSSSSLGQQRTDRPIQLQANLSGGFISVAGNSIADETVDDLKVNRWTPGVSLGYHFSDRLYLGYSLSPPMDLTLKESWGYNLDGEIVLDHTTGTMHSIESRYSPFDAGFYLSAALMNLGEITYAMEFRRKYDRMRIGDNGYSTDVDITWDSETITRAGFGLGYNRLFASGISINLGLSIPTQFPDGENIEIVLVNHTGAAVNDADLLKAEMSIQDEMFYGPVFLFVNVGYNLARFW